MFKIGDKVVCININCDNNFSDNNFERTTLLKIYTIYIIDDMFMTWIKVKIPSTSYYGTYSIDRFVSIKEYRKMKLQNINICLK